VSALADRLRGVMGLRPGTGADSTEQDSIRTRRPHDAADAADVLGGEWRDRNGRRFLIVDRKYSPGYRHGRVAVADCLPPWPRMALLAGCDGASTAAPPASDRALFVDLETTGLAGGAGTYAFLVGCGWFDGGVFHLRQFLLADFDAEAALLESFAELAADVVWLVTYNGKTFDLPLIETRFALHRMSAPFARAAHVDMLHPARRMWREDEVECRLTYLEQTLCGHEREGDVPGFEIPSRYFQYVRSGDPRPLAAVLEHNRLDIVSLAMLTARASQMLDEGPSAATTDREAFGMGRLYERAGLFDDALCCFQRPRTAEAIRAAAVLLRRLRRYEDAAACWRRLLAMRGCPASYEREAMEALAVHHEHRVRDLEAARSFAVQCLRLQGTAARQEAVKYRVARLDRKLGSRGEAGQLPGAPLF